MRLRTAILTSAFLLVAAPAFAQSCSMCYSTAKATSKDGQRAISKGVVVLLVPPLGFMTLGVWMAFRYSKKRDFEQNGLLESVSASACPSVFSETGLQ
jgi:hypothetical protein